MRSLISVVSVVGRSLSCFIGVDRADPMSSRDERQGQEHKYFLFSRGLTAGASLTCALKLLENDQTMGNSSPYIQVQYASVTPSGKNRHMNKLFCGLLASLFVAVGAKAQTVEGDWQGTIKANNVELRLRLHVTKDEKGALKATFDSIDQGARGLPISAISLKDSTLKFERKVAGWSYEGKVNADHTRISGTWTQGGRSFPLEFTRITAFQETEKKTPKPSDIDGAWIGGLSKLRIVLHIITYEDGMTAKLDSPDQDAFGIPVTTITRDGAELKFEIKSIRGRYEGKINPERTTMSGNWKQEGDSSPLVLKRTSVFPKPEDAVTENKEEFVPMRDGVRLALDLYFPSGPSSGLPVVLERTPYNKAIFGQKAKFWTARGYVFAIQDVRGRFRSEGRFELYLREGPDGYDTIE